MITQSSFNSSAATDSRETTVRILVICLILLLAILHQDWWWWEAKEPLVFGFMPIGLAWHAGISLAAGLVGLVAVKFCWPDHLDDEVAEEAVAETEKEEGS
ncbi:MAG: DUF3311 domain-containing protein [Planctomycetota bacterium]|nr:DUF3311 domain-containing protein [Planctomycetota bacterium]MEC9352089.1 DUF3311 domain-containing protein [Planctomycetota bacterium]